ncbi:MAG: hypothetical protein AB7Q16_04715 [Vicinamibacterales bacterium]
MPLLPRRPLSLFILVAALVIPAAALLAQGRAATPAQPAAAARVPEPKDVFGFAPGDDYKLASHEQIVDYFRKLDAASDRIGGEESG